MSRGFTGENRRQTACSRVPGENWTTSQMKTYRKAKDNNRSTVRARKDFPFKDEMDDFIGKKASTNPQLLIDSHIQLTKRSSVGRKDREGLQNMADGWRNCVENLNAMNPLG